MLCSFLLSLNQTIHTTKKATRDAQWNFGGVGRAVWSRYKNLRKGKEKLGLWSLTSWSELIPLFSFATLKSDPRIIFWPKTPLHSSKPLRGVSRDSPRSHQRLSLADLCSIQTLAHSKLKSRDGVSIYSARGLHWTVGYSNSTPQL